MTKLNQIVAVEKGVKSKAQRAVTDAYHSIQKTALFSGIARTYRPKDDDGDMLPPESTRVQLSGEEILREMSASLVRLFDVTLTKDSANCNAKADVVVDGHAVLSAVPVTYLLFLEKQLIDVRTFVTKLPVLDPAEKWTLEPTAGYSVWAAETMQTTRTKKVPRNHVKAPATDKHPAQVEMYYEDVVVGYWSTIKFSGALPVDRVHTLLERVDALLAAVKYAREEANGLEIVDAYAGKAVFDYLFA